jgi:hypothetical protein
MGFLFAWSREGKWLTDAAFNLTPVFSEAIRRPYGKAITGRFKLASGLVADSSLAQSRY